MSKVTKIELVVEKHGFRRMFTLEHATKLLAAGKNNGGWALPKDSKYYYSEQNGIRLKGNRNSTKKSE